MLATSVHQNSREVTGPRTFSGGYLVVPPSRLPRSFLLDSHGCTDGGLYGRQTDMQDVIFERQQRRQQAADPWPAGQAVLLSSLQNRKLIDDDMFIVREKTILTLEFFLDLA